MTETRCLSVSFGEAYGALWFEIVYEYCLPFVDRWSDENGQPSTKRFTKSLCARL